MIAITLFLQAYIVLHQINLLWCLLGNMETLWLMPISIKLWSHLTPWNVFKNITEQIPFFYFRSSSIFCDSAYWLIWTRQWRCWTEMWHQRLSWANNILAKGEECTPFYTGLEVLKLVRAHIILQLSYHSTCISNILRSLRSKSLYTV